MFAVSTWLPELGSKARGAPFGSVRPAAMWAGDGMIRVDIKE